MSSRKTGLPVIAVNTDGMEYYDRGLEKTYISLLEEFCRQQKPVAAADAGTFVGEKPAAAAGLGTLDENKSGAAGIIGIWGYSPLDFAGILSEDDLREWVRQQGYREMICWDRYRRPAKTCLCGKKYCPLTCRCCRRQMAAKDLRNTVGILHTRRRSDPAHCGTGSSCGTDPGCAPAGTCGQPLRHPPQAGNTGGFGKLLYDEAGCKKRPRRSAAGRDRPPHTPGGKTLHQCNCRPLYGTGHRGTARKRIPSASFCSLRRTASPVNYGEKITTAGEETKRNRGS